MSWNRHNNWPDFSIGYGVTAGPSAWPPLLLIAAVVASGTLFRGYDSVPDMAVSCILNCTLLILMTLRYRPTGAMIAPMRLPLALATAAILWATAATALVSVSWPEPALPRLLSLASGLAMLIVGVLVGRFETGREVRRLLDILLTLQCTILLFGLTIRGIGSTGIFDYWTVERGQRFTGTVGNATVTAVIAGAFCLHSLSRLVEIAGQDRARNSTARILKLLACLFALGLTAGVVLATASRFTTLLTLGGLGAILLTAYGKRHRSRSGGKARTIVATLAVGAIVAVPVALVGGRLEERAGWLAQAWDERTDLWSHYLQAALAEPWLGYGLGTFPALNAHILSDPRFAERAWAVNSAHDIVLQLLIVGGLPYLLLIASAAAAIGLCILRSLRGRWTLQQRTLALMAGLIFGSSLVDLPLDMPVGVSLFLLLSGLLWGQAIQSGKA